MKNDKRHRNAWKKLSFSQSFYRGRRRVSSILANPIWKRGASIGFLEAAIARRLGVPSEWVIATNSCTSALAMRPFWGTAPLMTYAATNCNSLADSRGCEDRYVDCDDDGWPEEHVDVGVDLWGREYPRATGCRGVPAVLDAAHRFCAPEHKLYLEAGSVVCFSTGPMKELPGFEGGFYCKKMSSGEREDAQAFFNYGQKDRTPTGLGGINGYMNEVCAAFLLQQLREFDAMREHRLSILDTYRNYLGAWMMTTPENSLGHLAVIRLPDEGTCKRVKTTLRHSHIETGVHYPIAEEHKETNAYRLSKRILSIPCHTRIQPKQAARIAQRILQSS